MNENLNEYNPSIQLKKEQVEKFQTETLNKRYFIQNNKNIEF